MADSYPPIVQRPALLEFAKALVSRDSALRRDECGDWRITGSHGHIYAIPGTLDRRTTPGFQIYVRRDSVREWSAARKALTMARPTGHPAFSKVEPFCNLTNDGDDEGMLFLNRLPTADEAETIRRYCGIAKKRTFDEEQLADMRKRLLAAGGQFQPKQPAPTSPPPLGDAERPDDGLASQNPFLVTDGEPI
jgi:hypothetical protein